MDELRSRYRLPRRDYDRPAQPRPAAHKPTVPAVSRVPTVPEPAHPRSAEPAPPAVHHQPVLPEPAHRQADRPKKQRKHRLLKTLLVLIFVSALVSGGYYLYYTRYQ